jgi:hypothetical protein
VEAFQRKIHLGVTMPDLNLFDLNKPEDLYRILQDVYKAYIKNPTEKDFFILSAWINSSSRMDCGKIVGGC